MKLREYVVNFIAQWGQPEPVCRVRGGWGKLGLACSGTGGQLLIWWGNHSLSCSSMGRTPILSGNWRLSRTLPRLPRRGEADLELWFQETVRQLQEGAWSRSSSLPTWPVTLRGTAEKPSTVRGGGGRTQDHHRRHQRKGLDKQQKYNAVGIYSLACKSVSGQHPSADDCCSCSYLAPGRQFPLSFGCRPAVPKVLSSSVLPDRNSPLNDPALGSPPAPSLTDPWWGHCTCHPTMRKDDAFKEQLFPGQKPGSWNSVKGQGLKHTASGENRL